MTRVLVVDDQPLVRSGFRMVLEERADLELVGEAADGVEALELARELDPDVILMDVRMPNLDGVEATRQLVESGTRARILVLTTFDLDEYVYAAIRAGASGFLLKDVEPAELVDAIRVVAAGNSLFGPAATERLVARFAQQPSPDAGRVLDELTEREKEILTLLASGLSNAELAEKLFLSETTVKTHVSAILRKLRVRDRVQAVIAAYDAGSSARDDADHLTGRDRLPRSDRKLGDGSRAMCVHLVLHLHRLDDADERARPRPRRRRRPRPTAPCPASATRPRRCRRLRLRSRARDGGARARATAPPAR